MYITNQIDLLFCYYCSFPFLKIYYFSRNPVCINLCDVISDFRIVAMSVIVDLQAIFHTHCVGILMNYEYLLAEIYTSVTLMVH
jgi:hypothetical protein